jgi:hypothetical protein
MEFLGPCMKRGSYGHKIHREVACEDGDRDG